MPTMLNGEEVYTMKEAAEYLGISGTALNNRIKRLNIQKYKGVGRESYVKKSDLDSMKQLRPIEDHEK